MKKSLLILSLVAGIILISIPSIMAQSESTEIPSWIKGVANFWVEGGIDDSDFIEALEYLIDNNVIKLGENAVIDNSMSSITIEEKEFLELTINQKEDRIKILENEINTLNNKISSMPVQPSESEMITNLNKQIDTLRIDIDEGEERKDQLEERLMKDNTELKQSFDEEFEIMRLRTNQFESERNEFERQSVFLQIELESVQAELDKLKQN